MIRMIGKAPKCSPVNMLAHPTNRENSFLTALCEAAFMTGLERNADVVELCTYAPLFACRCVAMASGLNLVRQPKHRENS